MEKLKLKQILKQSNRQWTDVITQCMPVYQSYSIRGGYMQLFLSQANWNRLSLCSFWIWGILEYL